MSMNPKFDIITPDFNHPEVKQLYHYDVSIPREILTTILSLQRKTLIEDLEFIIVDADKRFGYFCDLAEQGAPFSIILHTINLLKEVKSEDSLPKIISFLKTEPEILDFWLGDHVTESLWEVFYVLGSKQIPELKRFIMNHEVDCFARNAASQALVQMALHDPSRKDEIQTIFIEMLEYFIQANEDDDILDPDFIALTIGDTIDLQMKEQLPLIKELFQKDLVNLDFTSDYESLAHEFNTSFDYKKDFRTIFELYDHVQEKWSHSHFWSDYDENEQEPVISEKIQRNEPCPCGSGKKYKNCCMRE